MPWLWDSSVTTLMDAVSVGSGGSNSNPVHLLDGGFDLAEVEVNCIFHGSAVAETDDLEVHLQRSVDGGGAFENVPSRSFDMDAVAGTSQRAMFNVKESSSFRLRLVAKGALSHIVSVRYRRRLWQP